MYCFVRNKINVRFVRWHLNDAVVMMQKDRGASSAWLDRPFLPGFYGGTTRLQTDNDNIHMGGFIYTYL